jgi:AmmeMemoRadiSam system protein B
MGEVPVDRAALQAAREILGPRLVIDDRAHALDHALQVQLPFLRLVLDHFTVAPLLVGAADARDVADLVARLGPPAERLVVVSSDLSHFHDDATARRIDEQTASSIVHLAAAAIGREQACGCAAVAGLLTAARELDWEARVLALGNSGDVTGRRDRVVGYGAFSFQERTG